MWRMQSGNRVFTKAEWECLDIPIPEHTAVNEGTIAAIFAMLGMMIETECHDGGTTMRKALLAAMAREDELPPAQSKDVGEWDFLIDSFSDRVLWDSDYAMAGTFADMPPGQSAALNKQIGVGGESYFGTIVREPAPAELVGLSARLRLVRGDDET